MEQGAAEWQHVGSPAVGEKAEIADAGKASRQHMLYETAQELFGGKYHRALLAVVSIVLPAEADLSSCRAALKSRTVVWMAVLRHLNPGISIVDCT